MNAKKHFTALALAVIIGIGALLPPGQVAQAAEIQPLPFQTYVNGSLVTINNSLLYGGHTYVQLRELANVSNMGIEFNDPNSPSLPTPGGSLPIGISIDQPTFVYTKDDVQDWSSGSCVILDKAVDITTLYSRYQANSGKYNYAFEGNTLVVPNENGGTKTIDMHIISSYGKTYVSVDEFREKIQPYLIDICMQ